MRYNLRYIFSSDQAVLTFLRMLFINRVIKTKLWVQGKNKKLKYSLYLDSFARVL